MRKTLSWICVIWNGGWLLLGTVGLLFNAWWNSAHPQRSYPTPLLWVGLLFIVGPALNIATAIFGAGLAPDRKALQRAVDAFD